MSNELSMKQSNIPSVPTIQQKGNNNVHVDNQSGGTINFNYNINYPQMADSSAEQMIAIQSFSKEYYQLIVTCEEDVFSTGVVSVGASRALTKYNVPPEIFERCSTLTEEGIAELRRFPAIICQENTEMKGVTSPNQFCMLCYIQKVMVVGNHKQKQTFHMHTPIRRTISLQMISYYKILIIKYLSLIHIFHPSTHLGFLLPRIIRSLLSII